MANHAGKAGTVGMNQNPRGNRAGKASAGSGD